MRLLVAAALLLVACALATEVVEPSVVTDVYGVVQLFNGHTIRVPQLAAMSPPVITLSGPALSFTTIAKADGSFAVRNVPIGLYVLTVEYAQLQFNVVRVSVIEGRAGIVRVRALVNDATQAPLSGDGSPDSPLEIVAAGRLQYYVPREEYSIFSLLKNPMILMMLVSVGMMGIMKLIPQDELKQQMKEMNKQVQDGKQQLGLEKKAQ